MSRRVVIHLDMDAFYASVEALDAPELAGLPVLVGGTPEGRGVVAAASYEARRFGVHSAMPMARALRLCPDAVLRPVRMARYAEVSDAVRAVLERYSPLIEPLSLDEAFVDVTASRRLFGGGVEIGRRIQREILSEIGLGASVGVAPNKFLAKVASDLEKPAGFVVVEADRVQEFLDPLPVGRLWGVGAVTEAELHRHGIRTIAELRRLPPGGAARLLGSHGEQLERLARGEDERPVVPEHEAKSISNEITFAADLETDEALLSCLQQLCEQVAWRMRRAGRCARTVQIKVRFADFSTVTRARTLARASDLTSELWESACELFERRLPRPRPPVRLLGVGVSGLQGREGEQGDLFADGQREREARLDRVADAIRARFGRSAARRGRAS